jgi:hypothetical protein
MGKKFRHTKETLRVLAPQRGTCIASDRILVDGRKVGFMYREAPDHESDSGWRFFSGEEDQAYADDPANFEMCSVNTAANYDEAIIPYLDAPIGTAFGRIAGSDKFAEEEYEPSDW